jgi:hypothetical protein
VFVWRPPGCPQVNRRPLCGTTRVNQKARTALGNSEATVSVRRHIDYEAQARGTRAAGRGEPRAAPVIGPPSPAGSSATARQVRIVPSTMATDRRGLRATTLVPHNKQMQLAGGVAAG